MNIPIIAFTLLCTLLIIPLVRMIDKISFVYRIFPAFIIYKAPPRPCHGQVFLFYVLIKPFCQDDKGLLAHELTHVKQFYRIPFFHGILYTLSRAYRLKAELEAYAVQMRYNPENINIFAEFLATRYGLDISVPEAHARLRQAGSI